MKPMMKCGHAANAKDSKTGQPCCAICSGLDAGADQVAENQEIGMVRLARCAYYGVKIKSRYAPCDHTEDGVCRCERSSQYARDHEAFFERVQDRDYDRFYCGCRGWD